MRNISNEVLEETILPEVGKKRLIGTNIKRCFTFHPLNMTKIGEGNLVSNSIN